MKSAITLGLIGLTSVAAADVYINEFLPNPTGSDPATTSVELRGAAGTDFSGWILSIESDNAGSAGTVDRASQVSGTFDSNGLLVVNIDDLENPSFTLVLASSFGSSTGTDFDANGDGILDDTSAFGTIYDAVGISDTNGEPVYGASLGFADIAFTGDEPRLAFRDGVSLAWYAVNDPDNGEVYDAFGNAIDPALFTGDPLVESFGAVNATLIPAPGAIALVGLGGLVATRRRR